MLAFISLMALVIASLGLNSVANADTWVCLDSRCTTGIIKERVNNNLEQPPPRQRTTNIWNSDGSRRIISEDLTTGRINIWNEDGSHNIISTEEK